MKDIYFRDTCPLPTLPCVFIAEFFLPSPFVHFETDAAVVLLGNGLLGVRDALLQESCIRLIDSQDDMNPSPETDYTYPSTRTLKLFLGSSTHGAHITDKIEEEPCDAAGSHALSNEVWTRSELKRATINNRMFTIEHSGR